MEIDSFFYEPLSAQFKLLWPFWFVDFVPHFDQIHQFLNSWRSEQFACAFVRRQRFDKTKIGVEIFERLIGSHETIIKETNQINKVIYALL